ncbi:MAG: hypothetical protein D6719_12375 [Candidatus Dadabacteria bacterium]|nr:MAG: hypothetical protein D6719_12375 [Candidatus Dadabacteria bacterium]
MNLPYFAYGSNLSKKERHSSDLSGLRLLSPAILPDFALAFTRYSKKWQGGVSDIVARRGSHVPGALLKVEDSKTLEALDYKEGYFKNSPEKSAYIRKEYTVLLPDGSMTRAFSYEVRDKESFIKPAESYFNTIKSGLRENRLSCEHLRAAAENKQPELYPALLFIYGTLMRGESHHYMIKNLSPVNIKEALCRGRLYMLNGYPGLVLDNTAKCPVSGELVEFQKDSDPFKSLDDYEDFSGFIGKDFASVEESLYYRTLISVTAGENCSCLAWTYVYRGSLKAAKVISSGSWRTHKAR